MKDSLEAIVAIISITTFLSGLFVWYKRSIECNVESKRDFAHMRKNQEQIGQGMALLLDKIDDRMNRSDDRIDALFREVAEVKAHVVRNQP